MIVRLPKGKAALSPSTVFLFVCRVAVIFIGIFPLTFVLKEKQKPCVEIFDRLYFTAPMASKEDLEKKKLALGLEIQKKAAELMK